MSFIWPIECTPKAALTPTRPLGPAIKTPSASQAEQDLLDEEKELAAQAEVIEIDPEAEVSDFSMASPEAITSKMPKISFTGDDPLLRYRVFAISLFLLILWPGSPMILEALVIACIVCILWYASRAK